MSRVNIIVVSSVRFEMLLPVTYTSKVTGSTEFVQFKDIRHEVTKIVKKYLQWGGYTISNPEGARPFAGVWKDTPLEQSLAISVMLPAHLVEEGKEDLINLAKFFQKRYEQGEVFLYSYSVNRYMPEKNIYP